MERLTIDAQALFSFFGSRISWFLIREPRLPLLPTECRSRGKKGDFSCFKFAVIEPKAFGSFFESVVFT